MSSPDESVGPSVGEWNALLAEARREKEVLVKEIHHRVKNNLQVITSLLSLQARQTVDVHARTALQESQNRVKSIAIIHELLYQSPDLSRVGMREYAERLCGHLSSSFRSRREIRTSVSGPEIYLELDVAIPLAIVLNEIVSNSFRHAFPPETDDPAGTTRPVADPSIRVTYVDGPDDRVSVTVSDNGVGAGASGGDAAAGGASPGSLGTRLVASLARQLRADVTTTAGEGTRVEVTLPRHLS